MKAIIFILSIFSFGYAQNVKKDFELVILDSYLKDSRLVNVELKNNTKFNYCFVIDTTYEKSEPDFNPTICNPKVILYNLKNREVEVLSIKMGTDDPPIDSLLDFTKIKEFKPWVSLAKVICIKAKKSIYLKIPFDLVIKYKNLESPGIYQINRKKKYFGRIEYMIKREYIEKYIPKEKIDSLERKGYKFFTGKIVSTKVPLILK
ncbi:hypothetical protein [Flavobacterium sp. GSP14]|uniref:hypothetical protein n=1 Tax=Flavobacterium sp. GSP14 TaxID=3401734 RepID=UPI003AAEC811